MKILKTLTICLCFVGFAFSQTNGDFLKFKAQIGFDEVKERIAAKQFSNDGTKLTLIGLKSIQIWDIPTAKLIESHPHEIVQLDKFYGTAYEISPDGNKVITLDNIGRDGDKKEDRVNAYAYDVNTGKRIAVLERPDFSVRFAFWSANNETVVTFSGLYNQKKTEISFWNGADLSFRKSIVVDGYTWHYLTPDGERLYVGNGGTIKILGLSAGENKGDAIRIYNTRTAAVEKTFDTGGEKFAVNKDETFVSSDSRYIAAVKHKNVVVWDTTGKSQPIYELTAREPKDSVILEGFSGDGKYLLTRQHRIKEYYDTASGQLANDVPKILALRRENKYEVQKPYSFIDSLTHNEFRRENSVLQTPDGRYAVTIPCEKATVLDLATSQSLYSVDSSCHGDGNDHPIFATYDPSYHYYSYDFFRLSPNGKLLLNFRYDQLVVRDLKTGTILQKTLRKQDADLMNVSTWRAYWDIKGSYALTTAKDEKSFLIWKINED